MLDLLLKYPSHLNYLLIILINFSTVQGIEDDFIYSKYFLVEYTQEILREYPYTRESSNITEGIYWLWQNLIVGSNKARTAFFDAKFVSHIGFLLSNKDVEIKASTVRILSLTISWCVSNKIEYTESKFLTPLIQEFEGLLYSK